MESRSVDTSPARTAYVAWFAAEGRYCPFPKHLSAWAERFGFDPEVTALDQRLWSAAGLSERHGIAFALVDRVLALSAQ